MGKWIRGRTRRRQKDVDEGEKRAVDYKGIAEKEVIDDR